jgi:hypothetical protein
VPAPSRRKGAKRDLTQWSGPWLVHFFQRHPDEDSAEGVPAREFLDACPIAARLIAVVKAVADTPPPQ